MLKVLCFCIALSFYTLQVKSQSDEYTWEDYNGTIPSNAMPASDDPNNPAYIGQVLNEEKGYNCTGTILPAETETNIICGQFVLHDNIKILTVTDKEKFKWLTVSSKNISNIDEKDLIKTNYHDVSHSYWYVGRMKGGEGLRKKEVDGTLEVGDIIYKMFYSSKSNLFIDDIFDALVRSKEKTTKNETVNSETEQTQEVGSKDLPSQPCPKISQTEIDSLNPAQRTIDANVGLKVEAAGDAQTAPKEPFAPKVQSALNAGQKPTAAANVDLKVEAVGGAQVVPNAQAALKPPSSPKASATPEAPSAPKAATALNPGHKTIDANVNLKVESAADVQAARKAPAAPKPPFAPNLPASPKEPYAPKIPTSLNPGQSTADANVNFNVEAASDVQGSSKAPAAPEVPAAPKEPSASGITAAPKEPSAPEAPSAPEVPTAPKEPSAPKSQSTSCLDSGADYSPA